MEARPSVAAAIAGALRDQGVERMFGIPGGGSSLDLIDAADRAGIDFVLTATETAAVMMAAVTAELTGTPGVALAGIGPGAAAAVNGIAYAHLEQAPVIFFNDAALALIDVKQQRQQRPSRGVRMPPVDFAAAGRALGCHGVSVGPDDDLGDVLERAFSGREPVVVDVAADASGYLDQLAALRGS